MAFGKEIKRLRDDRNLSVKDMATAIGISMDKWRKWEERDLNPRYEDTVKIEEFFHMTIKEIMELKILPNVEFVPREKTKDPSIKVKGSEGKMLEKLVRIEARQISHEALLAELYSKASNIPVSQVLKQLQKDVTDEADKILGELNK